MRGAHRLVFFTLGVLSISLQIILLRELMVALGGDEAAVGLGLAAWLAGLAAGAGLARSFVASGPARWASASIVLLALSGPVQVVGIRLMRLALAASAGELLPIDTSMFLALASLAPAGALVGIAFTSLAAAAKAVAEPGRGIAVLYVCESLGALAGGLGVTFLLVPLLTPVAGAALTGATCLALALPSSSLPLRAAERFLSSPTLLRATGLILLAVAAPPISVPIERLSVEARFAGVAPGIGLSDWTDTPYQHVAVGRTSDAAYLYAAGRYAGAISDELAAEAQAHTVACLAPRVRRVFALGGVALGTLRFLLRFPVERIDIVEPDRAAFDLVRRHLAPADRDALTDPRVRVLHDDPRRFLARSRETYDLVLAIQPDPVTLLLSRMTTVEFFRLVRDRLGAKGTLVTSVVLAPASLTGETAALGGSIYGALREVYPVVRAAPGPEAILVAGRDEATATLDPQVLADRWRHAGVPARAFAPEMFSVIFPVARVRQQQADLEREASFVPESRDRRPVSFLHALARRMTIAGGAAGTLLSLSARAPRWIPFAVALLAAAAPIARRLVVAMRDLSPDRASTLLRGAGIHAVLVTGACGMVWSLLILFSYQTSSGALYGRIGVLTASFMTGLAAGAQCAARAATADATAARKWLVLTTGAALVYAAVVALVVGGLGGLAQGSGWLPMALHGGLLLMAGMVTGAVFPASAGACLSSGQGAAGAAGTVEAADHIGAAPAALLAVVLFIPMYGLARTAWLLAALQASAVVVALTPTTRKA